MSHRIGIEIAVAEWGKSVLLSKGERATFRSYLLPEWTATTTATCYVDLSVCEWCLRADVPYGQPIAPCEAGNWPPSSHTHTSESWSGCAMVAQTCPKARMGQRLNSITVISHHERALPLFGAARLFCLLSKQSLGTLVCRLAPTRTSVLEHTHTGQSLLGQPL